MKYNEFEQLNNVLENKGISLDDFLVNSIGKNLFEANESEIDTTKGNIFTRSGRAKMRLNNNAKKVQTAIMNNLFEKYYKSILNNKTKLVKQAIQLRENDKTIDEIKELLHGNLQAAAKAQASQLNVLDKAADKILMNYTKKMDSIIQQSKMTDNNKLKLSNYWVMLTSQIKLNLFKFIQQRELKYIKNTLNGDEDEQEITDMVESNSFEQTIKNLANNVNNNKEKVKSDGDISDEEVTDDNTSDEETTDNITQATDTAQSTDASTSSTTQSTDASTSTTQSTDVDPKEGEVYQVKSNTGDDLKYEVIGVNNTDITLKRIDVSPNVIQSVELSRFKKWKVEKIDNNVEGESEPINQPASNDEVQSVEAEEINAEIKDDTSEPIKAGNTYEYESNGTKHTIEVISVDENGMKFKKDGKEEILIANKAIASKMKFHKALDIATDKSKKRAIPLSGQENTSNQTARPMSQSTVSSDKKKAQDTNKAAKQTMPKRKVAPSKNQATGKTKIATNKKI